MLKKYKMKETPTPECKKRNVEDIILYCGSLEELHKSDSVSFIYKHAEELHFMSKEYPHKNHDERENYQEIRAELAERGFDGLVNCRTLLMRRFETAFYFLAVEGTPIKSTGERMTRGYYGKTGEGNI